MDNTAPRPLYPRERDAVPVFYEVGLVFEFVWRGAKDFSPNGIRSPDRLPPSESPNRLRYPGPLIPIQKLINKLYCTESNLRAVFCLLVLVVQLPLSSISGLSRRSLGFHSRPHIVTRAVEKVAIGQDSLRMLSLSPVSIIPPLLHTHSTIRPELTEAQT
jgi:hypothetical protein